MTDRPPARTSQRAVGVCRVCGEVFDRRRYDARGHVAGIDASKQTCPLHLWTRSTDAPIVDRLTPYQHDVAAQLFVATFRGGATLDAVAEAIGVSRERVRQIEVEARGKLRALGLGSFGVDESDPGERRDGRPRHDEASEVEDAGQGEAEDDDADDDATRRRGSGG